VNIWQSYKQERGCLVHFVRLANALLKDGESARNNHVLACNFTKYSSILIFFHSLHLKYVATLPFNLSLMACFADINVSQGSVATYARCDGMFTTHLNANLLRNLAVKRFDRIMVMSLWPPVFGPA